ncbi:CvpA family protein, partial [Staphylococcus aureus]
MVIDFIIIIFFVYFVIVGFRRGFWLSMIHLSATIVSLWIASQFYKSIVKLTGNPQRLYHCGLQVNFTI